MNDFVVNLKNIKQKSEDIGGKARSLANLMSNGIRVPGGSVISGLVYENFLKQTGLRGRILIELARKDFSEMRWEEIWDASQRIRNMFNTTIIPTNINEILSKSLSIYSNSVVAVRSSAIGEDSSNKSFAGLHDSYLNILGIRNILEKTKFVWSSLWSDSALLYRRELELSIEKSKMPVIVQKMVFGQVSGVIFSMNPRNKNELVLEAVYGLCKGLVDGTVEPDRWILERKNKKILNHYSPIRKEAIRATKNGLIKKNLNYQERQNSPLSKQQVVTIANMALKLEKIFGKPQDIEWTIKEKKLFIIQSRPITAKNKENDIRGWYLSLKNSLDKLVILENKIIKKLIPEMKQEAEFLKKAKIVEMTDSDLIEEINYRTGRSIYWNKIYWDNFIPMAHGMRLFGQIYNDKIKPEDPYEFVQLLEGSDLLSLKRNKRIKVIADLLTKDKKLLKAITNNENQNPKVARLKEEIIDLFGGYSKDLTLLIRILKQTSKGIKKKNRKNLQALKSAFINSFAKSQRKTAEQALRIGRSSWKLRDDDNILLGRFITQQQRAVKEAKNRLLKIGLKSINEMLDDEVILSLVKGKKVKTKVSKKTVKQKYLKPRQILGQPAGPGLVTGKARVIESKDDIFKFKKGEILVIDSIDPNMTFIIPLASGIIERRGGMLIHGAIIAREYGIACVTGISEATNLFNTGDIVTVDGYLGLVTINI